MTSYWNRSIVSAAREYPWDSSSRLHSWSLRGSFNDSFRIATICLWSLLGIYFNTARIKWTWHICQLHPWNECATEFWIPLRPSEIIRSTFVNPLSFRSGSEKISSQVDSSSQSAIRATKDLSKSITLYAGNDQECFVDISYLVPSLEIGGIYDEIRDMRFNRAW